MARRALVPASWLVLCAIAACHRDLPTAPDAAHPVSTSPLGAALAGFTDAIDDAQTRILPALRMGTAVDALAGALTDLKGVVSQLDTATLYPALGRVREAVRTLQSDTSDLQDLDVVLLVVDGIDAAAHVVADTTTHVVTCTPSADPNDLVVGVCP